MSDLISRLAARATGQGARARPQVRSVYEPHATGDVGFDDGDAGPVAVGEHAAAMDRRDPSVPDSTVEHGDRDGRARSTNPIEGLLHQALGHRRSTGPDASVDDLRVEAPDPTPRRPAATRPSDDRMPSIAAVTSRSDEGPIADRTVSARPIVAAGDPAQARLERSSSTGLDRADRPDRPASPIAEPTVRIHIGRLDVRANLQAAPPPAAAPPERGPEGLSLQDYLDGKRSAR